VSLRCGMVAALTPSSRRSRAQKRPPGRASRCSGCHHADWPQWFRRRNDAHQPPSSEQPLVGHSPIVSTSSRARRSELLMDHIRYPRFMGLPASVHRDSHCQAVHRAWARSSDDMAHAGAAPPIYRRQRCSTTNLEAVVVAARPSANSRRLGTRSVTCPLLVKSQTDTLDGFARSAVVLNGPIGAVGGLLRRVVERVPTQVLKLMSYMSSQLRMRHRV
jgi:hypothetical protein